MNGTIREITKQEALRMLAGGRKVYYLNPSSLRLVELGKVLDGRLLVGDVEGPEGGETRKKRAARVDAGKIRALHEAGWSAAKIADEMGVAAATVYCHLKKQGEKGGSSDEGADEKTEGAD